MAADIAKRKVSMSSKTVKDTWSATVRWFVNRLWRPSMDAPERAAESSELSLIHYRRGLAAREQGKLERALEEFAQAATLSPRFLSAIEGYADCLDRLGRQDEAMQRYADVRRLQAGNRLAAPDRIYALRQNGQFTSEIAAYNLVTRRVQDMVLPFIARGNALLAEGRASEALIDYERALKLDPKLVDGRILRAEALTASGQAAAAIGAFNEILASAAGSTDALSGRAIAHMANGDVAAANADWTRQLELVSPTAAPARAFVLLRMAEYERALPELERAATGSSANPYWSLYRLTALRRLGRLSNVAAPAEGDWPAPLIAFHAGKVNEAELLASADTATRRAEAVFQLGVAAAADRPADARRWWGEVVERASPGLVEYAAARNELARLAA
jgi:tetratricopeptide (TPR) repeat protein